MGRLSRTTSADNRCESPSQGGLIFERGNECVTRLTDSYRSVQELIGPSAFTDTSMSCASFAVRLVGPVVCKQASRSRLSTGRVTGVVTRRASKFAYRGAAETAQRG